MGDTFNMPKHAPIFHQLASQAGIQMDSEVSLPWLNRNGHLSQIVQTGIPKETLEILARIFEVLCGDAEALAAKNRGSMRADFILRPSGTQVEYDEVQHFTTARLETLRLYPEGLQLGFDPNSYESLVGEWREKGDKAFAHKQAAEFPGERGRQRQRAYFDAFRDLVAPHFGNGPLIRIPAPDNDYEGAVSALELQMERTGGSLPGAKPERHSFEGPENRPVERDYSRRGYDHRMENEVAPNEIARRLGISGKTFRAWLRAQWRAGDQRLIDHALHNRWVFTPSLAKELEAEYRQQKF